MTKEKADRNVRFTRMLGAPREFVFRMWTEAAQLAQWWGRDEYTNPVCRIDPRMGGEIYIDMKGPDGRVYPMAGRVVETVPGERLAFTCALMEDGQPVFEVLTTAVFAEYEGGTSVSVDAKLLSEETPQASGYLDGMQEGWSQTLNRLMKHVTTEYANVPEVVITKTLNAPVETFWKAYSDISLLPKWGGPKGLGIVVKEFDFRPGGCYHYGMETPGGVMWGKWSYRDIAPRERLVLSVAFTDENGEPVRHPMAPTWPLRMLSIATFAEHGGRTTLTMRLRPLEATEEEAQTFKAGEQSMNQGFGASFSQLEELLGIK